MQTERNADSTPSDDQIKGHIDRLTGKGGPFELSPAEDGPVRFRRGSGDLRSLFNRAKILSNRLQLRHIRDFSFGEVARRSSELTGPPPFAELCLGIPEGDPFTWMAEFMFVVSNGNIAVPINGARYADAFRHHIGQTLFIDQLDHEGATRPEASTAHSQALQNRPVGDDRARRPAVVLFTSGTSGLPKPVFHSHEGVLTGLSNMLLAGSISAFSSGVTTAGQPGAASVLLMCPLSYIAGTAQFFLSFLTGCSIVVPVDRSAEGLASVIARNKITTIVGISRDELERIIGVPGIAELADSVRTIHVYGETLPADRLDDLRKVLPNTKIGQGYGMTEAFGPIAAFVREDADGPLFWKLPSIEAAVSYGSGLRDHGIGRLHVRGRNMMLGYAPPAASASFEWFDTGDEVELLSSGKMRILDRSSRVLRLGNARPIYLAEIEKRALQAKARDAAAWRPSEPAPPVVYLALVPTPEIGSDLGRRLSAEFGVEIRILHVPSIPRKHGGKIDSTELARMQSRSEEASGKSHGE